MNDKDILEGIILDTIRRKQGCSISSVVIACDAEPPAVAGVLRSLVVRGDVIKTTTGSYFTKDHADSILNPEPKQEKEIVKPSNEADAELKKLVAKRNEEIDKQLKTANLEMVSDLLKNYPNGLPVPEIAYRIACTVLSVQNVVSRAAQYGDLDMDEVDGKTVYKIKKKSNVTKKVMFEILTYLQNNEPATVKEIINGTGIAAKPVIDGLASLLEDKRVLREDDDGEYMFTLYRDPAPRVEHVDEKETDQTCNAQEIVQVAEEQSEDMSQYKAGTKEQVLSYFKQNKGKIVTSNQIANAIDKPIGAISSSLFALCNDGVIERRAKGEYFYICKDRVDEIQEASKPHSSTMHVSIPEDTPKEEVQKVLAEIVKEHQNGTTEMCGESFPITHGCSTAQETHKVSDRIGNALAELEELQKYMSRFKLPPHADQWSTVLKRMIEIMPSHVASVLTEINEFLTNEK